MKDVNLQLRRDSDKELFQEAKDQLGAQQNVQVLRASLRHVVECDTDIPEVQTDGDAGCKHKNVFRVPDGDGGKYCVKCNPDPSAAKSTGD